MRPKAAHSERARLALARLPEVDPAISALALWCQHRDGSSARTTTRDDTILYGAAFPLLALSEQTGLLSHHVLHVALRHSTRRSALAQRLGPRFVPALYDLACDALVNEALLQGGHALPRPAVRAADLVALLPEADRPDNVLAAWDSDQLYFAISGLRGPSGSRAGDAAHAYAAAQGFEPDLESAAAEGADAELWTGRVEQALAAGRRAGAGIGAVLHRFADLPKARTPWEVLLRRRIQKALAQYPRLSHRRPAKSWLAREAWARAHGGPHPVFEPGRAREDRRPRVVVGLDTSSSITDTELALFAAEALSLVRRAGAEAHLLGFDTEVHHRGLLDRTQTLASLDMRRGGGTDFNMVFAEAQALDPSLIVMLTDLDAELNVAVKAPVLWAVPNAPRQNPPFGDVIVMR